MENKNIESVLLYLDFKEINTNSSYYRMYNKDKNILFVYKSSITNSLLFSSVSGELSGNVNDLIRFYYNNESASNLNEKDRLDKFEENYIDIEINRPELTSLSKFNYFEILLKEKNKSKHPIFQENMLTDSEHNYYLFYDDEIINFNSRNLLGVLKENITDKTCEVLKFSDFKRSIFFSPPFSGLNSIVIFNNLSEMNSFSKKIKNPHLYILIQEEFNSNHSTIINKLQNAMGIEKIFLAFPDNIDGYLSDITYLCTTSEFRLKKRDGYIKINIPIDKASEIFIERFKTFKKSVEKEIEDKVIQEYISIRLETDNAERSFYAINIPNIANIIKGFLVLCNKYIIKNKDFKIIKPNNIFWNEEAEIKDIDKQYQLTINENIKKTYSFN